MNVHQMHVAEAMAIGESRYADALTELNRFGRAGFTQTGGMCAALGVVLERGYLLVTDVDDDLPWQPEDLRGWGVGFFWTDDVCEGPVVFVSDEELDRSPRALGELVARCLREVAVSRGAR